MCIRDSVISGSGNVAIYACEKAQQYGAKVVAMSDSNGYVYDKDGIKLEDVYKRQLFDGKYHPVDSKEVAFKAAACLAYKAACPQANPVLLEPIGRAEIVVPDEYIDVYKRQGNISRRGKRHMSRRMTQSKR